jgi:hypothetical protein
MIDGVYYVWIGRKEGVCFYFLERKGDGLFAEGASYLLEREQFMAGGVFDEVDVGEAALCLTVNSLTRFSAPRAILPRPVTAVS